MKETTRIIVAEITEIYKDRTDLLPTNEVQKALETLFSDKDDVHITVQDFEMEVEK